MPACAQAKQWLLTDFQEIQHTLAELHTFFELDGEDVQREWVRFTAKVDKKVEAALHHAVKRSLQELNRLLNGDSKTEVLPVFRCVGHLVWKFMQSLMQLQGDLCSLRDDLWQQELTCKRTLQQP